MSNVAKQIGGPDIWTFALPVSVVDALHRGGAEFFIETEVVLTAARPPAPAPPAVDMHHRNSSRRSCTPARR